MSGAPSFSVISGAQVHRAISGREMQVTEIVETAYRLHGQDGTVNFIARYIHGYLSGNGFKFDTLGVYDPSSDSVDGFAEYLARTGTDQIVKHGTAESLICSCDLIVFATLAAEPHIHSREWFAHNPLVLHICLRDLSPEIMAVLCTMSCPVQRGHPQTCQSSSRHELKRYG